MELAAIYHRPESEYAFLYDHKRLCIRLQTKKDDVKAVNLISGDPYRPYTEEWFKEKKEMKKIATTVTHDYWQIEVTQSTKRLSYTFHIVDQEDEEVIYGDRGFYPVETKTLKETGRYFRLPYFHEVDLFKAPEWVKRTVWYQIFPERFDKGDATIDPKNVLPWGSKENPDASDFYGGDLQGIINRLDYLQELGINGIYLTPVFEAASNHKYDTIDYKSIDPHFGDEATFKKLVSEAHDRGIKIMLDAVFNHSGYYSKEWQDVLEKQEKSIYKDWFHINSFPVPSMEDLTPEEMNEVGKLNYDTFAFTGHMPKLDTANPEVQDYLIDIATYWIKEFDIDAWRLDVANEVDHQFWKKFHRACMNEKEDFYILGEIWHSSQSWLEGDEFHAVMNYPFTESIEDYFIHKNLTPLELTYQINEQFMKYRTQTNEVQFNLFDSHDTARILTKANNNKELVQSMLAFMFMHTGTPCIYYGTEIGLDGGGDPDCRKCMIWEEDKQDTEMFEFTKMLIKFRKDYQKVLSVGTLTWHDIRNKENIIGFIREYKDKKLTAYFNQNKQAEIFEIPKKSKVLLSKKAKINGNKLTMEENGFVIYLL